MATVTGRFVLGFGLECLVLGQPKEDGQPQDTQIPRSGLFDAVHQLRQRGWMQIDLLRDPVVGKIVQPDCLSQSKTNSGSVGVRGGLPS